MFHDNPLSLPQDFLNFFDKTNKLHLMAFLYMIKSLYPLSRQRNQMLMLIKEVDEPFHMFILETIELQHSYTLIYQLYMLALSLISSFYT